MNENPVAAHLEIYPQPAHDRCDLVLHDFPSGKGQISLMDLSGRLIKEISVNITSGTFRMPLDLQMVAPGSYIVNITTSQTRVTEQIIKF
jgi:Secretion system C-terminal sorting domain